MSDTVVNLLSRLGLLGLAKGATAAAQATVTTVDADHNALDVTVKGTPALAADAATATLQGTGNTSLATLAGIVSAGKALVTETSAAAIKTACESILAKFTGGQAARAASLGVTLSTEDAAILTGGTQVAIAKGAGTVGSAVVGNPVFTGGVDGSGNTRGILTSAAGNVQTAPAKGSTISSSAAESSHVISASACLVAKIRGYNGNAGVRYFQGHNASSLPGNGAVPSVVSEQATSAHAQEVNFALPTDRFSTGCVVATSSTGATLTIGSADATFTVDLFPSNA